MNQGEFETIYANELTPKQRQVLQGFLQGLSDNDLAGEIGATHRSTATRHLNNISKKFGFPPEIEPDYRCILVELFATYLPNLVGKKALDKCGCLTKKEIRFPEGSEPLNSLFYQPRDCESSCYFEIEESGALIRIKAPRKMGKTSFLKRLIAHGKKNEYKTIYFNFSLIEKHNFTDYKKFLKDFFDYILLQLSLPNSGVKENFTMLGLTYQLEILLKEISGGIIFALDEIDQLFEYPEIYENFFPMLRCWNEKGNESEIWEKLRIVVAHSTEYYGKLDINQSPFNIGLPIKLVDLTPEQVGNLAARHGLERKIVRPIMSLVGGHPYLLRLAFYYLVRHDLSLDELLKNATQDRGIYGQHLREYLDIIEANIELSKVLKQVLQSEGLTQLKGRRLYQLESMGLIKWNGEFVVPRYRLYRDYFQAYF